MEFIIVLGVGIVIGMYVTSQVKCHIRQNIFNNNLKKYGKNNNHDTFNGDNRFLRNSNRNVYIITNKVSYKKKYIL